MADTFQITGPLNIQFLVKDDDVKVSHSHSQSIKMNFLFPAAEFGVFQVPLLLYKWLWNIASFNFLYLYHATWLINSCRADWFNFKIQDIQYMKFVNLTSALGDWDESSSLAVLPICLQNHRDWPYCTRHQDHAGWASGWIRSSNPG